MLAENVDIINTVKEKSGIIEDVINVNMMNHPLPIHSSIS